MKEISQWILFIGSFNHISFLFLVFCSVALKDVCSPHLKSALLCNVCPRIVCYFSYETGNVRRTIVSMIKSRQLSYLGEKPGFCFSWTWHSVGAKLSPPLKILFARYRDSESQLQLWKRNARADRLCSWPKDTGNQPLADWLSWKITGLWSGGFWPITQSVEEMLSLWITSLID